MFLWHLDFRECTICCSKVLALFSVAFRIFEQALLSAVWNVLLSKTVSLIKNTISL